jgi:peptidoglycan/LPS O-acetylase OafA/YrhL
LASLRASETPNNELRLTTDSTLPKATRVGGDDRWPLIDAVRLPAALGVIWVHTAVGTPTAELGRFSVPFFSALAAFMAQRHRTRRPSESFGVFAATRAERLLLPFVTWAFVYGVIRSLSSTYLEEVNPVRFTLDLPLRGPAYHLWFLPFVFAVTLLSHGVARVSERSSRAAAGVLLLSVGAAAMLTLYDSRWMGLDRNWYLPQRWLESAPAALLGIAYATTWYYLPRWRVAPGWAWGAIAVALIGGLVVRYGEPNVALKTAAGVAVLLFALSPTAPAFLGRVRLPAELAYGVYLSHVLFVEGAQDLLRLFFGFEETEVRLLVFAVASVSSVAFVMLAMRLRLRTLYGG